MLLCLRLLVCLHAPVISPWTVLQGIGCDLLSLLLHSAALVEAPVAFSLACLAASHRRATTFQHLLKLPVVDDALGQHFSCQQTLPPPRTLWSVALGFPCTGVCDSTCFVLTAFACA